MPDVFTVFLNKDDDDDDDDDDDASHTLVCLFHKWEPAWGKQRRTLQIAKIAVFNLKNDNTQHLRLKYVYFDVKWEYLSQSSTIIRGFSTFPYIPSINSKFKRSHSLCGRPVERLLLMWWFADLVYDRTYFALTQPRTGISSLLTYWFPPFKQPSVP